MIVKLFNKNEYKIIQNEYELFYYKMILSSKFNHYINKCPPKETIQNKINFFSKQYSK
jgi:hypothetical protein